MTDAEQYDYLASVQDNLHALIERTPPDTAFRSGHARPQRHRHINGVLRA